MARTSLKAGLDEEADKKGLTGRARQRYIGGTIRNKAKRGDFTIHRTSRPRKASPAHPKPSPATKKATPRTHYNTPSVHKVEQPKKKAYPGAGKLTKREKLELFVKENKKASEGKPYKLYSIYNKKTNAQHGSGTFRKMSTARQEAKNDVDAYNHPHGVHTRGKLV